MTSSLSSPVLSTYHNWRFIYSIRDIILVVFLMFLQHTQHTMWTVIISLSIIILTVIVNSWLWLYYSQHVTRSVWSVCPVITIYSCLVVLLSVCYCACLACLSPIAEDGNLSVVVGEVCWSIQYSVFTIINIWFGFYKWVNSIASLILNITFHHHSSAPPINIRISLSLYLWLSQAAR